MTLVLVIGRGGSEVQVVDINKLGSTPAHLSWFCQNRADYAKPFMSTPLPIVNDQNFSTNFRKGAKTSHQCKLLIESSFVVNHDDFAFVLHLSQIAAAALTIKCFHKQVLCVKSFQHSNNQVSLVDF